jgi:hypothetical protein
LMEAIIKQWVHEDTAKWQDFPYYTEL